MRVERLEIDATAAYANRRFQEASDRLTDIITLDGESPRWREMRAAVLVDGKNFEEALVDYKAALELTPENAPIEKARLLSQRGLAYEGVSDWSLAKQDYVEALDIANAAGQLPDPYVLNSLGNVNASLGEYSDARTAYLASSASFQGAKGFRGRGGSTTARLDGAVFSASNAALMAVQLGLDDAAIREMEYVRRRAPGSADMRSALAALYWSKGKAAKAEADWNVACTEISVGCAKFNDSDWLRRIRRWPPRMISLMEDFRSGRNPPSSVLSAASGNGA